MLGFRDNQLIIFPNNGPSLRMTKNNPLQSKIFQMFRADLTSISPKPIVGRILRSNFNIPMFQRILNSLNMKIDRSNDNINFSRIKFQVIDSIINQSDWLL